MIVATFELLSVPRREKSSPSFWCSLLLPRLCFALSSGFVLLTLAVLFACLCDLNCVISINEIEECGYVCLDDWRSESAAKRERTEIGSLTRNSGLATNIWSRRILESLDGRWLNPPNGFFFYQRDCIKFKTFRKKAINNKRRWQRGIRIWMPALWPRRSGFGI